MNLSIKSYGQGNNVILIHGFCESSEIWAPFINQLSTHNHILTIDIPGFGNSSSINYQSLDQLAQIFVNEFKELGIEKATIIGHSMGGYIALAILELFPEFVNGIGLFHSTPIADSEEKKLARDKNIQFVNQFGADKFTKVLIPNLFANTLNQDQIDAALKIAQSSTSEGIINALNAMKNRPDRSQLLQNSQLANLIIAGKKDPLIPYLSLITLASQMPLVQLNVLAESSHMGFIEETENTLNILSYYLNNFALYPNK